MKKKPVLIGGLFLALAGLLQVIGSAFSPALYDFMTAALPWLCIGVGVAVAMVSNDKK